MVTPSAVATGSTKVTGQTSALWEWTKTRTTAAGQACMWLWTAARLNNDGIDNILPRKGQNRPCLRTMGKGRELLTSHKEDAMAPLRARETKEGESPTSYNMQRD
ncbi:hypothetical protein ACJ73_01970, partial [Blastomyces percursus]